MARKETMVQKITRMVSREFLSLKGNPPMFAKGENIEEVVRFVLIKRNQLGRTRNTYDARDIMNSAPYLAAMSSKNLAHISNLKCREIRTLLKDGAPVFSRLNQENLDVVRHLPPLWVRESARLLLQERSA